MLIQNFIQLQIFNFEENLSIEKDSIEIEANDKINPHTHTLYTGGRNFTCERER